MYEEEFEEEEEEDWEMKVLDDSATPEEAGFMAGYAGDAEWIYNIWSSWLIL